MAMMDTLSAVLPALSPAIPPAALAAINSNDPSTPDISATPGLGSALQPDVVNNAIGQASGIQQSATKQALTDPLMQAILGEYAKSNAAQQAVMPEIQQNMAKRKELLAKTDGPLPPPPDLMPLPAPPPAQMPYNPLRTIGQFLPVLAALGSGGVRNNATIALNSAAAAMNAAHADDQEQQKAAHQSWEENTQLALNQNKLLSDRYNSILQNRKISMDERMAQITALATSNQDALALAQMSGGHPEGLIALQNQRDAAAKRLQDLVTHSQDINQKQAEADQAHQDRQDTVAATMRGQSLDHADKVAQINMEAGKRTANEVMAPVFQKMQQVGWAGLSKGEQESIDRYHSTFGTPSLTDQLAALGATNGALTTAPGANAPKAAVIPADTVSGAKAALARGVDPAVIKQRWVQSGYPEATFDKEVLGK